MGFIFDPNQSQPTCNVDNQTDVRIATLHKISLVVINIINYYRR